MHLIVCFGHWSLKMALCDEGLLLDKKIGKHFGQTFSSGKPSNENTRGASAMIF
jgi:hypothetical protein